MILIHNDTNRSEYFSKLTAAGAKTAMERLSANGLKAWLKCLAGHTDGFAWKYPDLTADEMQELSDTGFLIPTGCGTGDYEFDAAGEYGAALSTPILAPPRSTYAAVRRKENEQKKEEVIDKSKVHFTIVDGALIAEYEGKQYWADRFNDYAYIEWKPPSMRSTGYKWNEALAVAEECLENTDDSLPF